MSFTTQSLSVPDVAANRSTCGAPMMCTGFVERRGLIDQHVRPSDDEALVANQPRASTASRSLMLIGRGMNGTGFADRRHSRRAAARRRCVKPRRSKLPQIQRRRRAHRPARRFFPTVDAGGVGQHRAACADPARPSGSDRRTASCTSRGTPSAVSPVKVSAPRS